GSFPAQGRRFSDSKRVGVDERPERCAARIAYARRASATAAEVPPRLFRMVLAGPAGFGRISAHGALVEVAEGRQGDGEGAVCMQLSSTPARRIPAFRGSS